MENSILKSVKQILAGLDDTDDAFDQDILTFINTAIAVLDQIGVSPMYITDDTALWGDLGLSQSILNMVKTYVNLKVKMFWDPSALSFVIAMQEKQLAELEWRINSAAELESAT
jgi:hypothetical protein